MGGIHRKVKPIRRILRGDYGGYSPHDQAQPPYCRHQQEGQEPVLEFDFSDNLLDYSSVFRYFQFIFPSRENSLSFCL